MRVPLFLLVLVTVVLALGVGSAAQAAPTHRSGCHRWHSCPSDHATYRWRGLLCVAPYADENDGSFKKRVVYEGRTYLCKR